jgi:hypothetical protein
MADITLVITNEPCYRDWVVSRPAASMASGFAQRKGLAEFDHSGQIWKWVAPTSGMGKGDEIGAVLFGEEQRYSTRVAERRTLKLR